MNHRLSIVVISFFLLHLSPLSAQSPERHFHVDKLRHTRDSAGSATVKLAQTNPDDVSTAPLSLAETLSVTGVITTIAGSFGVLPTSGTSAVTQSLDTPTAVVPDGSGGFYFSSLNHHRVYRVMADGRLLVIAGNGIPGFSGDGGPAVSAQLAVPFDVAVDTAGNIYIADYDNGRIRKVTPAGIISTVAGMGSYESTGDGGPAISAGMGPVGIAVDATGNLFITDLDNNRVRKVNTSGVITAYAGSGEYGFAGDNGPATSAPLAAPCGLAIDATGNLFIADYDNGRIRRVSAAGVITTVAGNGSYEYSGDGGPATSAGMGPSDVSIDTAGNLFIADVDNERIRKVTSSGVISTVAGTGARGFGGEDGPATAALFRTPGGVVVDSSGNLFIADHSNNRVRKVTPAGTISTVAGNGTAIRSGNNPSYGFSGDGGPATSALMRGPAGVAIDPAGSIFIADSDNNRIRKVTASGVITTVAGTTSAGFSGDGGPATAAAVNFPVGVAVDTAGNLYIADSGNHRIRRVSATGVIATFAGNGGSEFSGDGGPATSAGVPNPASIAVDSAGNVFIGDDSGRIRRVTPAGVITTVAGNGRLGFSGDGGPATSAMLSSPLFVTVDAAGNVFIADRNSNRIRKVTSAGVITTVAGNGASGFSGDGNQATSARLNGPAGVAVDAAGNIYIADADNYRIRRVTPDGRISTVAGTGSPGLSGDGGSAVSAGLILGYGCNLAVEASGNLLIPDLGNNRIRRIAFAQQATYVMVDRGGVSSVSSGLSSTLNVGYAAIQPDAGNTTPSGLAIFGFRQNNILVSEAGVPASQAIQSGRIYAEVNGPVNTGLAIANPNNQPVTLTFYFTNSTGDFGSGTTTIPGNAQIAKFLNQAPFNGPASLSGTFTFNASAPVAVIALRGLTNERGEFLITTLPVAQLGNTSTASVVFPHFAVGGGWTTQIVLVNPGDTALSGTVQFLAQSSAAVSDFAYSIPARSSQRLQTAGIGSAVVGGSVRVVPAPNTTAPSGLAIFSFSNGGVTVAEAGVPPSGAGNAFRLYAEASGSIQTGFAVANTSSNAATVTVEATRLDGSSTGLTGTLSIPANGQTAVFLNQVPGFGGLQSPFQGVLRLSSSTLISVTGLRARYNERGDFLITTTPPTNEANSPTTSPLYFPHIVDSGGYTTQFILFNGQVGTVRFFSQSGGPLNVVLQ